MTLPTLGYRTRTDAVMALKAQGHGTKAIAKMIGITRSNVEVFARHARRRGTLLPVQTMETVLGKKVRDQLMADARKRRVTVDRLIVLLIIAIAEDNLVGAVLDDRGDA